MSKKPPLFVISLDFELMWGVKDCRTIADYGENILGVRQAIPAMLEMFQKYEVNATWAAVGFLLFGDKQSLVNATPDCLPTYEDSTLNPYSDIENIGANEDDDPYHFGLSLAKQIVACEGMELASHTFSHYYCLESGQTIAQFEADLKASKSAIKKVSGKNPISLVFSRNQLNQQYLQVCEKLGFVAYRGNPSSYLYRPEGRESIIKRGLRLFDAYTPISGSNSFDPSLEKGLVNIPASSFLRPYSTVLGLIQKFHLMRIKGAMKASAQVGRSFHLWWHPHNFGRNLAENLAGLEEILIYQKQLENEYGMKSCTMGEMALKNMDLEK